MDPSLFSSGQQEAVLPLHAAGRRGKSNPVAFLKQGCLRNDDIVHIDQFDLFTLKPELFDQVADF